MNNAIEIKPNGNNGHVTFKTPVEEQVSQLLVKLSRKDELIKDLSQRGERMQARIARLHQELEAMTSRKEIYKVRYLVAIDQRIDLERRLDRIPKGFQVCGRFWDRLKRAFRVLLWG